MISIIQNNSARRLQAALFLLFPCMEIFSVKVNMKTALDPCLSVYLTLCTAPVFWCNLNLL